MWRTFLISGCALACLSLTGGAAESHPEEPETAPAHAGAPSFWSPWASTPDTNQPPLTLNPYLLLFTVVSFVLFINIMKATAWGPMIAGFNERDARVIRAEQAAAKVQHEAERLKKETETKMAEVHGQVKAMLAKARAEAEAQAREIIANAEAQATKAKDAALRDIEAARQQTLSELSRTVDAQASLATRQLIGS